VGTGELILEDEDFSAAAEEKSDLMDRFVRHVKADLVQPKDSEEDVNLTIVRKEVDDEGHVHLTTENLNYHSNVVNFKKSKYVPKTERPGAQHLVLKQVLKEKIAEGKRIERSRREEMKKMEDEDGFAEELEEEEAEEELEGDDDEESEDEESDEVADEEEEDDEDDEAGGSKRAVRKRNAFLDDEAEDDDNDEENMDCLTLEEDSRSDEEEETSRGTLLKPSQTLGLSDVTPTVNHGQSVGKVVSADTPFSQPMSTPLNDRTDSSFLISKVSDGSSQGARKKLGFQGLFDMSDPNVDDLDDVVGLCSGQFRTQEAIVATQSTQEVQNTPDTVILSQLSQRNSTAATEPYTQDTVILSHADQASQEPEDLAPGFMEEKVGFLLDSDDEQEASSVKRKRKRIVLSDDSDSDDEQHEEADGDIEESEGEALEEDEEDEQRREAREVVYDSDENEVMVEKQKFKGFKGRKG
jgi:hypothetical protein